MSEKSFRVFYRDYINGISIPSTKPESQPASGLPALAKQLMQSEDSFLGIMDAEDLIMQGPPISICSMASARVQVPSATVFSKG